MPRTFNASRLKIHRAREHVRELENLIKDYLASRPAQFSPAQQIAGTIQFGSMSFRGIPENSSAILGDIIHNLRASLDLMACELCRMNKQSDKDVYFPFSESEEKLDEMIQKRHFDRAGEQAIGLLKALAPYKGGNVLLRAIHDLDIQDKHRSLIPTETHIIGPTFRMDAMGGSLVAVPIGDHSKASDIRIMMPPGSALADNELIPTVYELTDTAENVIKAFESLSTI